MASSCRFSFDNPNVLQEARFEKILAALRRIGMNSSTMKLLSIEVTQEAPDAEADIVEGYNDELDGVAVPVVLDIVSSDAGDTSKAGTIYGLDGDGVWTAETFTLDAADATSAVTTVTEWCRIFGVELDAACAGTITVHENGGAVSTYCTVTIADLFSITTRVYVPNGWQCVALEVVPKYEVANGATPV